MAAEDREQFIIRDEEESRKSIPLGVQIVVKALLAPFQSIMYGLEVLQSVLRMTGVQHKRILGRL